MGENLEIYVGDDSTILERAKKLLGQEYERNKILIEGAAGLRSADEMNRFLDQLEGLLKDAEANRDIKAIRRRAWVEGFISGRLQ